MDGGLLQKQSKQVINMTMGTRTEVSNKDAGEEGAWGWWGVGRVGGELCREGGGWGVGGRDTKVEKKCKKEAREQKTLMCVRRAS